MTQSEIHGLQEDIQEIQKRVLWMDHDIKRADYVVPDQVVNEIADLAKRLTYIALDLDGLGAEEVVMDLDRAWAADR